MSNYIISSSVKKNRVFILQKSELEKLKVGDVIQAQATLLAGPFGGRAVIEKVKKLK